MFVGRTHSSDERTRGQTTARPAAFARSLESYFDHPIDWPDDWHQYRLNMGRPAVSIRAVQPKLDTRGSGMTTVKRTDATPTDGADNQQTTDDLMLFLLDNGKPRLAAERIEWEVCR